MVTTSSSLISAFTPSLSSSAPVRRSARRSSDQGSKSSPSGCSFFDGTGWLPQGIPSRCGGLSPHGEPSLDGGPVLRCCCCGCGCRLLVGCDTGVLWEGWDRCCCCGCECLSEGMFQAEETAWSASFSSMYSSSISSSSVATLCQGDMADRPSLPVGRGMCSSSSSSSSSTMSR